jgi:nucleoporin p58/p45
VTIDVSNIKGTTRFNDLHEDIQKQIQQIDELIQQEGIRNKEAIDAALPQHGEQIGRIPEDTSFIERKCEGVSAVHKSDVFAIQEARQHVKKDWDHAQLVAKGINMEKFAPSERFSPSDADADLTSQLTRLHLEEVVAQEQRCDDLGKHVNLVGTHMENLAENVTVYGRRRKGQSSDLRLAELSAVLREFEAQIRCAAAEVESAREAMTELQLKGFMGGP